MSNRSRRWCSGGKIKHPDAAVAELHRGALELYNARHGRTRPGRRLTVYWCTICSAFHVGSQRDTLADVPPGKKDPPPGARTLSGGTLCTEDVPHE